MSAVTEKLAKIAQKLKEKGLDPIAKKVDKVQEVLEQEAEEKDVDPAELMSPKEAAVNFEYEFIKEALDECNAADIEIEAAKKKKKKWVQKIDLKKGRLKKYKKPGESMEEAAHRALNSDDPSVRGMGSFYFAAKKMRSKKASEKKATKAEHRPSPVFQSTDPKVTDNKDHFPINDEAHARNALARANQYSDAPSWYDGSLKSLKKTVADAIKNKYPGIEVTEDSYE